MSMTFDEAARAANRQNPTPIEPQFPENDPVDETAAEPATAAAPPVVESQAQQATTPPTNPHTQQTERQPAPEATTQQGGHPFGQTPASTPPEYVLNEGSAADSHYNYQDFGRNLGHWMGTHRPLIAVGFLAVALLIWYLSTGSWPWQGFGGNNTAATTPTAAQAPAPIDNQDGTLVTYKVDTSVDWTKAIPGLLANGLKVISPNLGIYCSTDLDRAIADQVVYDNDGDCSRESAEEFMLRRLPGMDRASWDQVYTDYALRVSNGDDPAATGINVLTQNLELARQFCSRQLGYDPNGDQYMDWNEFAAVSDCWGKK